MPFTLEELLPDDQRLRNVQLHEPVQSALMRQWGSNEGRLLLWLHENASKLDR
jgi:hypothetical protein